MCHFLPVYYLGIVFLGRVEGQNITIEQNCSILTPTLMAITAFLSRSPGLLNRSLGAQPLWDMVLIPASSLQLQLLNREPEDTFCWVLVLSTASYLQLTRTSWAPSYIIVLRPLNSTCRQSRLFPSYLRPDAPVIYTGAFPILTARPESICNSKEWSANSTGSADTTGDQLGHALWDPLNNKKDNKSKVSCRGRPEGSLFISYYS